MIWQFSGPESFMVDPSDISTNIISSPTRKNLVRLHDSVFRCQVAENCVLLGYYATSNNPEKRSSHHVRVLAKPITCHGYALTGLRKCTVASYSLDELHRSALHTPLTAYLETNSIT